MAQRPHILFLADHRQGRSPGQRFRFEQFLPDLQAAGFRCTVSHLLTAEEDRIFYGKGNIPRKALILARHWLHRWKELRREKPDIVFVSREALLTGSVFFENAWKRKGVPVIFDFDDSIWLPNVSDNNRSFAFLKDPGKTRKIIALADLVIAGNDFLKSYATPLQEHVTIVPTTIDMEQYDREKRSFDHSPVVIGWSGSLTTIAHFRTIEPVLMRIRERFGERVSFRVIGDAAYHNAALDIHGQAWSAATEVEDLLGFDIGIMPLPDDDWTRGKCGLKGLQYMALGVPTLMSAVGVNTDIIRPGENGMLATDDDGFYEALVQLVEDARLRERLGRAGRLTVLHSYSRQAWKERYIALFRSLLRH